MSAPTSARPAVALVVAVGADRVWGPGKVVIMDESDLSALRERAEHNDQDAVDQLIELASEQGNLDELRRLADQGNTTAREVLGELDE